MVGAIPVIVRLKFLGAVVPPTFVALTAMVVVAITLGIPVSSPAEDKLAHPGSPVAAHVIGVTPLAAN